MKLEDLLKLDLYSNIPCEWCGKNMIVKEAIIEGVDNDNAFVLCAYCDLFKDWDDIEEEYKGSFEDVKKGYNEELLKMWIGLNPLPIDYI